MNTTTNVTAEGPAENKIIDGAITEMKPADPALAVLNPTQYATELFKPYEDKLAVLRRAAARTKYDIATKEGMEKAKEFRAEFVKVRTTAEKKKTEAKRPIDECGKKILEHFNKLADAAKVEEEKHAKAIKDEEARLEAERLRKLEEERIRVETLQRKVDAIRAFPSTLSGATSDELRAAAEEWAAKRITREEFEDYVEEGLEATNQTVDELRRMLDAALQREEGERQRKAEQEELARLRAEQEKRDAAERERQAREAEAAAEREREMAAMRAEQEKQQRIMQSIQDIQQRGKVDGDARTLLEALESARAVRVDVSTFGAMLEMATMAKDMAITAISNRYSAKLVDEVPAAWSEAIAENLEYEAKRVRNVANGAARQYARDIESLLGDAAMYDKSPQAEATQATTQIVAQPAPPTDDEIIVVLAAHFGADRQTVAAWLIGMSVEGLRAIASGPAE